MEINMNLFITTLFAFLIVSVVGQQGGYGRRRRPRPRPDTQECNQVGVCGGFANAGCPPGSTCRRIWPTQTAGPCCSDNVPEPPHNTCSFGTPGGSCTMFDQECRRHGYTCQLQGWRGTCCRTREGTGTCPRPSGRAGICVFNPERNCLRNSDCAHGQICCTEGCGKVCMDPVYLPEPILY